VAGKLPTLEPGTRGGARGGRRQSRVLPDRSPLAYRRLAPRIPDRTGCSPASPLLFRLLPSPTAASQRMLQTDPPPDRPLEPLRTDVVIIGAGPAGLAAGACLARAGIPFLILEREDRVAPAWHRHYDRLHLHTTKEVSALPYRPYPREAPRYASRLQVIDYLESYAREFGLEPRFGEEVRSAKREGEEWHVVTPRGTYRAPNLIVATGSNAVPVVPDWPGREHFRGTVIHSFDYRNGEPFRGRSVLVIGIGNSGAEIALDLWEHGARPSISVRGEVLVMPRDVLGVPITRVGVLTKVLPPRVVDELFRRFLRLVVGNLARYGLRAPPYGPLTQIQRKGRIPLIDVGTVRLIRKGLVRVRPEVRAFDETGASFVDGTREDYDAVIVATGFTAGWDRFLELGEKGAGRSIDELEQDLEGLYFTGMKPGATGMLRQVGDRAHTIVASILERRKGPNQHAPGGSPERVGVTRER
jgi:cation diffusion facilitator CzcD-associated flavoprotein CzcO